MRVRYVIIIALASVTLLSLTLFLLSKYVQPIMPQSLSSDLLLIAASVIGVVTFLAALKDVIELVEGLAKRLGIPSRSKRADAIVSISPLMKEVGFKAIKPVIYEEYYCEEKLLEVPSRQGDPIYHIEVFRNTEGLDKSKFRFIHKGNFQISHPLFAKIEGSVRDRLSFNESRLRVAKIDFRDSSLEVYCQEATYSQVLVTNHSDELVFDGMMVRDVFAPSIDGKLPSFQNSLAANPAGCNCLLETNDNYLVIQRRSDAVQTNVLQYTPSVSGGTEYSRSPWDNLDPFIQLLLEMREEIGLGRHHLTYDPLLLAISRDVQRNGLPEFFFHAKLKINFDEVHWKMKMRRPRDAREHTGVFALPIEEPVILDYVMGQESSLALKANLIYYLELLDVVRDWCEKQEENASEAIRVDIEMPA